MILLTSIVVSGIIWAIMLVPYHLWLRKTTLFIAQRVYLYAALIGGLGFGILFYYIQTYGRLDITALRPLATGSNPAHQIGKWVSPMVEVMQSPVDNIQSILYIIYFTGGLFLVGRLIYQIQEIYRIAHYYSTVQHGRQQIIETTEHHTPFTFLRLIFFSKNHIIEESDKLVIYEHERIHSRQLHSIDIFLCELLGAMSWFVPILWIYKRYFNELHEWIADEAVIRNVPLALYGRLLISQSLGEGMPFTHHFSSGDLKNRILKMKQARSGKWNLSIFILYVLILLSGINVFAGLRLDLPNALNNQSTNNIGREIVYLNLNSGFTLIPDGHKPDIPPTASFPGGNEALKAYFSEHLGEVNAITSSEKGTYTLKIYLDEKGDVANMSIVEPCPVSIEKKFDEVVRNMPNWIAPLYKGRRVSSSVLIPVTIE